MSRTLYPTPPTLQSGFCRIVSISACVYVLCIEQCLVLSSCRGGAPPTLFPSDLLVSRRSFPHLVSVSATLPVRWRVVHSVAYIPNLGAWPEYFSRRSHFGRSSWIRELVTTLLFFQSDLPPYFPWCISRICSIFSGHFRYLFWWF